MKKQLWILSITAVLQCAIFPSPAAAVGKCKVKIDKKTGVIRVDASGVSGPLLWGKSPGTVDQPFFNAATCVAASSAKRCELADPNSLAARTPPSGCMIHLDDAGAPCSVWIRGCAPGPRTSGAIVWKDSAGETVGTATDTATTATRFDGVTYVRIPVGSDGSTFEPGGQVYFTSNDCSGPVLLFPDIGFIKNVAVLDPSGLGYYGPLTGAPTAMASYLTARADFVDTATCEASYGIGATFVPPYACCSAGSAVYQLGPPLTTPLAGFTPPFHLEDQ